MKRDFRKWHGKKEQIESVPDRPFFHEREIWFAHIGANVGSEQDGTGEEFLRPVIIVRKFNNEIFWGVPLTRRHKKSQYYFPFNLGERVSIAILSLNCA